MGNIESGELWTIWDNINPNPHNTNTGSSSFFRDGENYSYNVSRGPSFRCDVTRSSSRFNYNVNHMTNSTSSSSSMVSGGGGESSGSRRVSQRFNILSSLGEWSSRRSHFYTLDNASMEDSHYGLHYCRNHGHNDDDGHMIQEPNDMWRCGDHHVEVHAVPEECLHTTNGNSAPKINTYQKMMNKVAPEETGRNVETPLPVGASQEQFTINDIPFLIFFVLHLMVVSGLILFFSLRDMKYRNAATDNVPRSLLLPYYPELASSVLSGAICGIVFQTLFRHFPSRMAHSIAWISSMLTLVASLFLIIIASVPPSTKGRGGDVSTKKHTSSLLLWLGSVSLVFALAQSVYAFCFTVDRKSELKFAGDLLYCSFNSLSHKARGTTIIVSFWFLLMAATCQLFWCLGIVSVMSIGLLFPLVIIALLISMAWTLGTLRNVVVVGSAHSIASSIYNDPSNEDKDNNNNKITIRQPSLYSTLGSISFGSFVVPLVHFLKIMAKALSRLHVNNEMVFLGAHRFYEAIHKLSKHANNWAYIQVGIHHKPFLKAAKETSDLFSAKQLDVIVSTDLTSSFCVLSGICGGMISVLTSGGLTFGTHQTPSSSLSIVSFFIGYFSVRLMMASTQASVMTHYVCFAQNPASHKFLSSPVPERLKELLANVDVESAAN